MSAQGATVIDLSERRRSRDAMRMQSQAAPTAMSATAVPAIAWMPVWFVPVLMVPCAVLA